MMNITLKQMRYAVVLATEEHFGRAAEKCGITQPALSQQIAHLELDCGAAIFERLGKRTILTPFGQEFVARTRRILQDIDALTAFTADQSGQPTHVLRIGVIPTIAPYLLPIAYPALRKALPALQFTISETHTETLLERVVEGELDLALIATDPPAPMRLVSKELCVDPFVLAASNRSTLTEPVQLQGLPQDKILLLDEGHCFRDQAIEACALRDPEVTKAFAATSLSTIVEFVANGQGYTLLPTISLKKEAADPRIRIQQLAAPGASRTLRLVWRARSPFSETFEEVGDILAAAAVQCLSGAISYAR